MNTTEPHLEPPGTAPEPLVTFEGLSPYTGGASRTTVHTWREQGIFPAPLKLGGRRIAWKISDIKRWQDERQAEGAAK